MNIILSWELYENFCNGYGLDQLREGLLLKESYATIYHLLGTEKLPRKNNSWKIVRFIEVSNDCYEIASQDAFRRGVMIEIW